MIVLTVFVCADTTLGGGTAKVWRFAAPFDVSTIDLLKLFFLFGTTQFGLGLVFLTVGGQMVSTTENALVSTVPI